MNLYFLLEGRRTEPKVYRAWVKVAFPNLREVRNLADMTGDTFLFESAEGYPRIMQLIEQAVGNLADYPSIDHLFVCLDAEEVDVTTRRREVDECIAAAVVDTRLRDSNPGAVLHPIVQDCCIETWLLGHRRMMRAEPQDPELRRCWEKFDVRREDPERLPNDGALTRAAYHLHYLVAMFRERGLSYGKTSPGPVLTREYLHELVARVGATKHLQSLRVLLDVWRGLGADLPSG